MIYFKLQNKNKKSTTDITDKIKIKINEWTEQIQFKIGERDKTGIKLELF